MAKGSSSCVKQVEPQSPRQILLLAKHPGLSRSVLPVHLRTAYLVSTLTVYCKMAHALPSQHQQTGAQPQLHMLTCSQIFIYALASSKHNSKKHALQCFIFIGISPQLHTITLCMRALALAHV